MKHLHPDVFSQELVTDIKTISFLPHPEFP